MMMRRIGLSLFLFIIVLCAQAQSHSPKLVVGIVIDQMRAEYLYRFYDQYGENGFKRLMNEGFNCRNVHYNYVPTYTGPGHTSIYAGTTPRYHGITGNSWYDRDKKQTLYCVDDPSERLVGVDTVMKGASPRNLLSTNISDELKISTNEKATVISLSLKDRAAVLPAGHMANGAFWFDQVSGNFVSSTFYMKQLPQWAIDFNKQKKAFQYIRNTWNLLLPEESYPLSIADDNHYEVPFHGKDKPTFPYNLQELAAKNPPYFKVLYTSPFGNSLLTDFAIGALEKTNIGRGVYSDLLAISYSSTDAIGHRFGPMSKEVNDTYIRMDREIARLLDALDKYIGKGNYTVFLTADHGMGDNPDYLIDRKIPGGYCSFDSIGLAANRFLIKTYGNGDWIEYTINEQIYLNRVLISNRGLDLPQVQNKLAEFLRERKGIARVFTASQLDQVEFTKDIALRVQNGYYAKRCGDVRVVLEPGWNDDAEDAATHGTVYSYDTQVPLLWYGAGIKKGESFLTYNITDIAPTISMMLRTKLPSACIGVPIAEVLGK
jgi:predicted AlkP superfamily pyrophosphatase or phosphodiesterase